MPQQQVNCLINTCFLPVKTWLLIACDTAFHAIITFKNQTSCSKVLKVSLVYKKFTRHHQYFNNFTVTILPHMELSDSFGGALDWGSKGLLVQVSLESLC